jgi:hypothetical protein
MRQRLIKVLDYKERQWLFKAVFRMILSDKNVADEEVDELMESLKRAAGRDIKDFKEVTHSPDFQERLKPLKGISYEHAFIILAEIVRVAALDSKVVLEEEELIKEILSLLDFGEEALEKVMKWAKRLALVNAEEAVLKNGLITHYLHDSV